MTIVEDRLLRSLRGDWYWIVADQTRYFDNLLLVPIKDRTLLLKESRIFFEFGKTIKPDQPAIIRLNALHDMLNRLETGGEDINRLKMWYASLAPDVFRKDPYRDEDPIAINPWMDFFERCALGRRGKAKHIDEAKLADLVKSYRVEVHNTMSNDILPRFKASEQKFMSGPEGRSDWDNYLWEIYFGQVVTDCTTIFMHPLQKVLNIQWYRQHHIDLNGADKEQLYNELIDNIQNFDQNADVMNEEDWSRIKSIDEAFQLDLIPDFDRYKRDW